MDFTMTCSRADILSFSLRSRAAAFYYGFYGFRYAG